MPSFARGTLKQHDYHARLHLQGGEQQGCYVRLQPAMGHIPLISSRREYLLSKARGGGGARCSYRNAESPKGLGEEVDGSGCGDAAAVAAVEMEAVARPTSTGATKAQGTVSSPPTTATHATTWPVGHQPSSQQVIAGECLRRAELDRQAQQAAMLEEKLLLRALLRHPEASDSQCGMPSSPGSPGSPTSPVTTRRCGVDLVSSRGRPVTVPGAAGLTKLPRLRPSSSMPLLQREVKACTDLPNPNPDPNPNPSPNPNQVKACTDLLQRTELKRGTATERSSVPHSHGCRFGQGGQHVPQQPLSPFLKGVISPYTKSPTSSRGAHRRNSPPWVECSSTRGGGDPRSNARSSAARGGGGGGGQLPTATNLPAWATPRAELTKAERVSVLPRIDLESLEWD